MIIDRPQAKLAAKDCMRSAQVNPYRIGLVYVLIILALGSIDTYMMQMFSQEIYLGGALTPVIFPSPINWFITILVSLISLILQSGLTIYILGIRRGKEMPLRTLFDAFSMAGRIIALYVVEYFFIFLWSLLFLIPGIIAMYRYRFAIYNLLENPEIDIMKAIALSKEQTQGFKMQLFMLDLSFLGWTILSMFTMGLLGFWLIPYMLLTDVAFYDAICDHTGISATGRSGWSKNNRTTTPDGTPRTLDRSENEAGGHKNTESDPDSFDGKKDPWDN